MLQRLFLSGHASHMPDHEREWLRDMKQEQLAFKGFRNIELWSSGTGPLVLLVHGWGGRGSQLGAFITPLLDAGYRVATFNAAGHGEGDGQETALPEMVESLERVIDHIGHPACIIAHSVGTASTTAALKRGLAVDRLVFIAPPERPNLYLEKMGTWLGFSPKVISLARQGIENRYGMTMDYLATSDSAHHMTVPLLVIHDSKDKEVPFNEGKKIARHWPGAVFHGTQGLGHKRILKEKNVIAQSIDFLKDIQPKQTDAA